MGSLPVETSLTGRPPEQLLQPRRGVPPRLLNLLFSSYGRLPSARRVCAGSSAQPGACSTARSRKHARGAEGRAAPFVSKARTHTITPRAVPMLFPKPYLTKREPHLRPVGRRHQLSGITGVPAAEMRRAMPNSPDRILQSCVSSVFCKALNVTRNSLSALLVVKPEASPSKIKRCAPHPPYEARGTKPT